MDEVERKLQKSTLETTGEEGIMMDAPEVHQLGKNLIQLIGAKRVLDIGWCKEQKVG